MAFQKVKNKRIFEQIVSQIRGEILQGTLKPGERLPSESEMARIFGVGRPALREALRTLEIAGLIAVRQGREGGTFVQNGEIDSIIGHFSDLLRLGKISLFHLTEARLYMETLLFDLMVGKVTSQDIQELRDCISRTEEMFNLGRVEERITENFYFHFKLAEITKNPVIVINISTINDLMCYFLVKIQPTRQISRNTIKAHTEIVDLLERGDFEGCKEANRKHINDVSDRLIKKCSDHSISEYPETFRPAIGGTVNG